MQMNVDNPVICEVVGYLESIKDLQFKITVLENQIDEAEARLISLKSLTNYKEVSVKSIYISNDEIPNAIIRIEELVNEKEALLNKLIFLKDRIIKEIFQLNNLNQSRILYYTYVETMHQEDIAMLMNYSVRHTRRILSEALTSFARIYYEGRYEFE